MQESILVVDDEPTARETLAEFLADVGYQVSQAADGEEALKLAEQDQFNLALVDMIMPNMDGLTLLEKITQTNPAIPVVIMTAFGGVDGAVEAMKCGAVDYVMKPFSFDELLIKIDRIFKERHIVMMNRSLKDSMRRNLWGQKIIGQSKAMRDVFEMIDRVAPTNSNVLITGESGSGKELAARAIHDASLRKDEIYLPVNCAAIPMDLVESELFGYIRGAFTDAKANQEGLFQVTDGGTLFMDEICSVPMSLQGKLLRAIELKEVLPVGSRKVKRIDVRIIVATNKDLRREVDEGRFREDLYYRLNVLKIKLPPLRERLEDVEPLASEFIGRFNTELGKNVRGLSPAAINTLLNHEWKGNVRELENVIERAMIMCDGEIITNRELALDSEASGEGAFQPLSLRRSVEHCEREIIKRAMSLASDDPKQAAELLEISVPSLYRKIRELGLRE